MKRFFSLLLLALFVSSASAVPAKKGIWKTLSFNGTEVRAQLIGDEHLHYWQTDEGLKLSEQDGVFVLADMEQLKANASARRAKTSVRRQHRVKRNAIGDFIHYTGQKKGLIILVEFTNMQFMASNDSLLYTRICNEEGFNQGQFRGSVCDYFKAQSYGEFELTFDVMGPVQMPNTYQYYGQNDSHGDDQRPGEMVVAACQAVVDQVDFSDYDWDGDGVVDQVMCIYAGQGENNGGGATTIWPHEWSLEESDYGSMLEIDSVLVNTYAVANERAYTEIEGIGTICHEFSHCLGLPDMYDIDYGGNFGMGKWSLMDNGSYNGNGFCPSGYSSFDKLTCGWVKPVELTSNQFIDSMKPLEDEPEVYMVRNKAYDDEYYLIENRQQKGWDTKLPGRGMLILYVDYDRAIWENNLVNTMMSASNPDGFPSNDHQRCTPFHADNDPRSYYQGGVAYPYMENDSLTNTSHPAATLYHKNSDGSKLMNVGIMDITRNDDETMSFRFRNTPSEVYIPEGTVFRETFDRCNGNGGNDSIWNTTIASSNFQPDNEGWEVTKAFGGFQCARFGTLLTAGQGITPSFTTETGEAVLTFKAAGWDNDGTTLTIGVEGEGTVKPSSITMEPFAWNEYSLRVIGKGPLRLVFSPEKRFLLDEILVVQVKSELPDAIQQTTYSYQKQSGFYTLDGRYVGSSLDLLPRGIYVEVGNDSKANRKIIK